MIANERCLQYNMYVNGFIGIIEKEVYGKMTGGNLRKLILNMYSNTGELCDFHLVVSPAFSFNRSKLSNFQLKDPFSLLIFPLINLFFIDFLSSNGIILIKSTVNLIPFTSFEI